MTPFPGLVVKFVEGNRGLIEFFLRLAHELHLFEIGVIVYFHALLVRLIAGFLFRFLGDTFGLLEFRSARLDRRLRGLSFALRR